MIKISNGDTELTTVNNKIGFNYNKEKNTIEVVEYVGGKENLYG